MNLLSFDAWASAIKAKQPDHGSRVTFVKVLLLAGAVLGSGLSALPADARLLVTTTGTITAGSETGGLFGLPIGVTDLAGDSYTLIVQFDDLGPGYFSTGDGSFAIDVENSPGMTGSVTAIINGHSLTTPLTNSLASSLIEDNYSFYAANVGYSGSASTGAFVDVSQSLACGSPCVPYADLSTPFSYLLGLSDFGTDLYTFEAAGFPAASAPIANFVGTEATVAFAPEPASWVLLVTGLLGLGKQVRRRRA